MGTKKISQLASEVGTIDKLNDSIPLVNTTEHATKKISPDNLVLSYAANATDVNDGTNSQLYVTPKSLADSTMFVTRFFIVSLCASESLTTSHKAFQDIPDELDGFYLVSWSAMCDSTSSLGDIVFYITNHGHNMFTRPLTIDEGDTTSRTSTHPAIVDNDYITIHKGKIVAVEVSDSGTDATYVKVTLGFRKSLSGSGTGHDTGYGPHYTTFSDVTGPDSAVDGNVAKFDGISGKILKDDGTQVSGINTGDETVTSIGDIIESADEKLTIADHDLISILDSEDGNELKTVTFETFKTGIPGTGDVQGPEGSMNETIAIYDGVTGKIIKDSQVKISDITGIHNELEGLQGGDSTSSEYYHLTKDEHDNLGVSDHNLLEDLQGGQENEYYHLTKDEHDNLGVSDHNLLNDLQGGDSTSNEYYHITKVLFDNLETYGSGLPLLGEWGGE